MKIFSRSLPVALTTLFNVILVSCFGAIFGLAEDVTSTVVVLLTVITGLIYLYKICTPFTVVRASVFFTMLFGFIYTTLCFNEFFSILPITYEIAWIVFVLGIDSLYVYKKLNHLLSKLFHKLDDTIPIEA